jgi:hypothetical protein
MSRTNTATAVTGLADAERRIESAPVGITSISRLAPPSRPARAGRSR